MSATTPRRASFDDLRVGQWVAWLAEGTAPAQRWYVVELTTVRLTPTRFIEGKCRGQILNIYREDNLCILEDSPAPPVTVRREDINRLRHALFDGDKRDIARFAEALIDNADTGAES